MDGLAGAGRPGEPPNPAGEPQPPALPAVLADAAARSGVERTALQLVRVERAEWPDSGLGCPRAGQLYLPVMTPGWRIEVRGGAATFVYHTDSGDRFVLCERR